MIDHFFFHAKKCFFLLFGLHVIFFVCQFIGCRIFKKYFFRSKTEGNYIDKLQAPFCNSFVQRLCFPGNCCCQQMLFLFVLSFWNRGTQSCVDAHPVSCYMRPVGRIYNHTHLPGCIFSIKCDC